MTSHDKLRPFCGDLHSLPFAITVDGARYCCATDNVRLAAIRSDEPAADDGPNASDFIRRATGGALVSIASLRAWCGDEPLPPPQCEKCDGKCEVMCSVCNGKKLVIRPCHVCDHVAEHECLACDGTGAIDCDCEDKQKLKPQPGRFGPYVIDRNLLRSGLALFGDDARVVVDGVRDSVTLHTDGVVFVMMTMRADTKIKGDVFKMPRGGR